MEWGTNVNRKCPPKIALLLKKVMPCNCKKRKVRGQSPKEQQTAPKKEDKKENNEER